MIWNKTDMDTCREVLLDIVILLQPLFLCIFTFYVFQTYDQQIFYDQYRPANPHIYWAEAPSPISEHWSLFIIIYSIYEKDEIIFLKDPSEYNCWMAVKTRTSLAILWTMLPHSNELKYQKCSFWWRVAALWPALQTQLHYLSILPWHTKGIPAFVMCTHEVSSPSPHHSRCSSIHRTAQLHWIRIAAAVTWLQLLGAKLTGSCQ